MGFTATLTIDGQELSSYTGEYSPCTEVACGASLSWTLYAYTFFCPTIDWEGSKTFDCGHKYGAILNLDGRAPVLEWHDLGTGGCPEADSAFTGYTELLDFVGLTRGPAPSGFTVHDPSIAE